MIIIIIIIIINQINIVFDFLGGHHEQQRNAGGREHDINLCHVLEIEPKLQTLTGEVLISCANSSNEARLDVGFLKRAT